jgi:preprotein translocase subunit SecA
MNNQRTVIYNKRRNALYGDRLSIDISNMFYDTCEVIYEQAYREKDFELFNMEILRVFGMELQFAEKELFDSKKGNVVEKIYEQVYSSYKERIQRIADMAFPFIKNIYENTRYENVAFPITDGKKTINIVTPVKKSYENKGREIGLSIEKNITLSIIDNEWKEHLRELDDLKQSVQNATYEQKDPLLIYKFESFNLFEKMLFSINREISSFLSRVSLPVNQEENMKEAQKPMSDNKNLKTSREEKPVTNNTAEREKSQPVRVEKKVGRNEPCPCGSGKKYKNCHGKLEE